MASYKEAIEFVGECIDVAGVAVIVVGAAVAAWRCALTLRAGILRAESPRAVPPAGPYQSFRHDLGRAILLGLEFLVAADIIRTVAVAPTLEGVLVLALVVFVRTLLSFSLQVELEGTWPWARAKTAKNVKA
jgi:uncharacterized membrane protein